MRLLLPVSVVTLICVYAFSSPVCQAAQNKQTVKSSSKSSDKDGKDEESPALWDYWYTITIFPDGKPSDQPKRATKNAAKAKKPPREVHFEYYNDRVEDKGERIRFLNRSWKKEEDFINEDQLGAFAAKGPELKPLFFNFHSTYRASEKVIDGNVSDGKLLTVKIRDGSLEKPKESTVKKVIAPKVFFSAFFPLWLAQKLPEMKVGEIVHFNVILEDSLEAGFSPVLGSVKLEKPDDIAKEGRASKFTVDLGEKALWWVEPSGAMLRIEIPGRNTVVERVSKKKAESFLLNEEPGTVSSPPPISGLGGE